MCVQVPMVCHLVSEVAEELQEAVEQLLALEDEVDREVAEAMAGEPSGRHLAAGEPSSKRPRSAMWLVALRGALNRSLNSHSATSYGTRIHMVRVLGAK